VKYGLAAGLLLLTAACASALRFEPPAPVDQGLLRQRAVTKSDDGIRASAATPTAEESRSIFGIDLSENGIQPLWLEIENASDRLFYFLPTGLDPEYFAPREVAFLYKGAFADADALGRHLQEVAFDHRAPILPGTTVSGFVFANRTDPTMIADIYLIGHQWSDRISLVVPVLGTEAAQERLVALARLHADADVVEIGDEATLRTALENLPCCATDETGASSLPLNLVLIGALDQWGPAFVRRNYRYAPASPWYAFGRMQDLSGHKISRWAPPQPHTLRIWRTSLRYKGKPVWVAQVSTRLGGRFAASAEGMGRIDPSIDEARNDLLQDLLYSQGVSKIGFVKVAGNVSAAEPQQAPNGPPYRTDGLRVVLIFEGKAVSLADIDFFGWERLVDYDRPQVATSEMR
jgi:hypothetical protein